MLTVYRYANELGFESGLNPIRPSYYNRSPGPMGGGGGGGGGSKAQMPKIKVNIN